VIGAPCPGRGGVSCELEEVVALVEGEPQRAGDGSDRMRGGTRAAALLQSRVEVGRHDWDTWFGSADPDGAARLAPDLGGTLLMGPVDTEHGRLGVLTDPSGAVFSVFAPANAAT